MMAKLEKVVEAVETAEEVKVLYVPATKEEQPSLNQLAIVLGIPAVRLQSAQVAYKPVEGKPYNPKEINYESVSAFIERRLDKTDFESVEEVYKEALATEYVPKSRGGRQAGEGSVYGKFLFGTTPLRKGNVKIGDTIYNKKTKEQCKVLFVNDTIVVYEPITDGEEKVVTSSIGNRMFNVNFDLETPKNTDESAVVADKADE